MHDAQEFLRSLAIVLAVAAVTTVLFQKLRQPVVLGYILAGLIVGPHVPLPIVADRPTVQTLSELGVILLMFSLGLEFSLSRLARVGPAAGFTAIIQCSVMAWLGFLAGRLFGWTVLESVFAGAMIAISSTTIIAKVFNDLGIGGRLRELVVGILLVEDLIAIVFLAALTAVASGVGLSAGELGATLLRLGLFLAVLLAGGMLVLPRCIRYVVGIGRSETTLVAAVGTCFAVAYLAQEFGYSVALGAFLAGSLLSESGHGEEIERLVAPLRDVFAAVFFVSVGLLIDPALVARHWAAILVLTALVVVGKVLSVSVGAFLTGAGVRTSVQAGMSLAQIGEFSFIIAAMGLSLEVTRDFLFPVGVAVSALTTLSTPWLIRWGPAVSALADRRLPHPLQTWTALHGAWLERLRGPGAARERGTARLVRLLAIDVALLAGLIIVAAVNLPRAAAAVGGTLSIAPGPARMLILGIATALSIPFVFGIGRLARRLGETVAARALPLGTRSVDLDAAPRTTLVLALQMGVMLLALLVVLALSQPVLPSYAGPVVLALLLALFGAAIWRSASDLEGHVRAGAQAVLEALARQSHNPGAHPIDAKTEPLIRELLPGLGDWVAVSISPESPAIGQSLSGLNLRGQTGATVLAIARETGSVTTPGPDERIEAGDVLALAGTKEAVEAAQAVLTGRSQASETVDPHR